MSLHSTEIGIASSAWTVEEANGLRHVRGGGVTIATRHSEEFLRSLAGRRPGLELVDELLRSEHPPYIRDRLEILLESFPERGRWQVLDFGCGAGASSVVLARLGVGRIVGVDVVNDYAPIWRRRLDEAGYPQAGLFVQAGDTLALPFRGGTFDAIFLNGVLEHLVPEERRDLLAEALRLARPGGLVFIAETPNRWFPRNSHTKLWFSEWLPFPLAAAYAARFGCRRDFPRSGRTAQYRTGFRGLSVPEIQRWLGPGAKLLAPEPRLSALEFTLPRNPLEASPRRMRIGRLIWQLVRVFSRLAGRPPAFFVPHLNLVFQKNRGSALPERS